MDIFALTVNSNLIEKVCFNFSPHMNKEERKKHTLFLHQSTVMLSIGSRMSCRVWSFFWGVFLRSSMDLPVPKQKTFGFLFASVSYKGILTLPQIWIKKYLKYKNLKNLKIL